MDNLELIKNIWSNKIQENLTISPLYEMLESLKERQDRVMRKHMTKFELFLFDSFKNQTIRKFATRKYRIEETYNEIRCKTINIYKKNILIDTHKLYFSDEVCIKGLTPCKK